MREDIGKLKNVPLREVWKHEASDFTQWLSSNLDTLGEALGLTLSSAETGSTVGDFYLDIQAEDDDGHLVIIENQLERTDHDHLGKLVTYLSNIEAKTAIWVTSSPREEHRVAISWLNEFTPQDVAFYLVQVQAVKIGVSPAAALFTVVAKPTATQKAVGRKKKELSERHMVRKEFWSQLIEKSKEKTRIFENVIPKTDHWIGAGMGKTGVNLNLVATRNSTKVDVYLNKGKEINKGRFDKLLAHKEEIEKGYGGTLLWERRDELATSSIGIRYADAGLLNRDRWAELQDRLIDSAIRLDKAVRPFIKEL
jgi:hypothetical protein